ncbi:50S ribosomal protein L3 N(5)-glutamine methyltransferase [Entomomonas sp. E2T0]|uniref:50S ribosomal protein L3 N(5)-glutamine methyltransferase n=1 Tax=Entomomonas sp. E2T0 TaxID=2930213 RepID=UPI002228532E|nr:50S ribosomal protein L3 N(5)-glutamine methyltransferase [Entomomonas sp. E2T0]UYZ83168.1 50S ribosomal protein L3 N(5)-glutamine methyltransferase [Entomomonas sp. E2T0]
MLPKISNLLTIRDYIRWSVTQFHQHDLFFGHGTDNAWDDARQLVLGYLSLPFDLPDSYLDCRLEQEEQEELRSLISERIEKRIPTAYLLGEAWFCGRPFYVDERVLIPRSPIGELILNQFKPYLTSTPKRILDLCCGSGCIGIACAQQFIKAEVVLADLSFEALEVANLNIERYHLDNRVYTVQGDCFDSLPNQRFDLIVCNPPYVDAEDMADIPPEFQHEPELGLAAGEDGLDIVKVILAEAANHLTEQGVLIVEVGNSEIHVKKLYPEIDFMWFEFAQGGHGVFLLTAQQCAAYQSAFEELI